MANKRMLHNANEAIVTQWTYESGLVEISTKIPEVLDNAGPILVAAAINLERSRKWRVSFSEGRACELVRNKGAAIGLMLAWAESRNMRCRHLRRA